MSTPDRPHGSGKCSKCGHTWALRKPWLEIEEPKCSRCGSTDVEELQAEVSPAVEAEAEEEEEEKILPPEIAQLASVKAQLREKLPDVYGIKGGKKLESVFETLTPQLVQDQNQLHMHILRLLPKANSYHLYSILNQIYGGLQPYPPYPPVGQPFQSPPHNPWGTPSYPYGYPPQPPKFGQPDTSQVKFLQDQFKEKEKQLEAKDKLLTEERDKRDAMLAEERDKRIAAQLALRDYRLDQIERGVRNPTGKTSADLMDKGIDKVHETAKEGVQVLKALAFNQQSFNPDVSTTPAEQDARGQEILAALDKTEELIDAENAFIHAANKVAHAKRAKAEAEGGAPP